MLRWASGDRTGLRSFVGRWGNSLGSRFGRREARVRSSTATVLGDFGGPGRRGMGRGGAVRGRGGRAQLVLENVGVEGVVPRWAELCSPAMVWARAELGLCPFLDAGGGRGFPGGGTAGGNSNWGSSAGGGADSARRSAMAMAWRAGARVAAVQRQESWFGVSLGAARWFGPGARHLSTQVAGAGVQRRRWTRCRENGGGRSWQWQFCNFLEVQNPVM